MPSSSASIGPSAPTVEWVEGGSVTRWVPSAPTDSLTIGRDPSCDLCLDPDDRGLSRRAAWIHSEGGQWWLTNLSASRPIAVREPTGLPSVLPVSGSRVIDRSPLTFVLTGVVRRHALRVSGSAVARSAARPSEADGAVGGAVDGTVGLPLPTAVVLDSE